MQTFRSLAVSAFAVLPPLFAQDVPAGGVTIRTEGEYLILGVNENDGLPLKAFIKLAGTITGKVFTYTEQELQTAGADAKITFINTKRLKKVNFFPFFQTMLYIKGLACIVRGDEDTEIIEIVSLQGPKRGELASSARFVPADELAQYANQTGVQILTSVPLEHINVNAAANTLRPFFVGTGGQTAAALQIGQVGNAKAMLLEGFGPQVYAAYKVLKLLDVPSDQLQIEVRVMKLEHAAAEELEPILKEILARGRAGAVPVAGASGADLQAAQAPDMKILAHASQNAVIMAGTASQIVEAIDLITRLDVPIDAVGGDQHVYPLKNVLAADLRTTINDFINQDIQAEQQSGQQAGATPVRRPRKTVVVAHEESNSLLISGTASKFAQLQKTIDELDRRQPQVLVECAVVELATDDLTKLGVELAYIDTKQSGDYTRGFGFTSFGLTTFQDTDDDSIPDTRLPDFENPLQGVTGGIISGGDFAIPVIINALETSTTANVLSLPSVLVNNNENAKVKSIEERPTQQTTQGNATTQSGFSGFQPAGIELNISPSISSNNYLRLNLSLEVSRFLTPFDPASSVPGVKATRRVETQVTMPTGHTMVLGGVIEDAEADQKSGIPILQDIPLLGWLFRTQSTQQKKTNLYFFLTPHILNEDDFSDLASLTFRKKLEAAEYIGHRRIQVLDRRWTEGRPETLDDPGATIEDFDQRGGFDIPVYQRPEKKPDSQKLPGATTRPGDGRAADTSPTTGPAGPRDPGKR
jgi:general secretion pathway protein D